MKKLIPLILLLSSCKYQTHLMVQNIKVVRVIDVDSTKINAVFMPQGKPYPLHKDSLRKGQILQAVYRKRVGSLGALGN